MSHLARAWIAWMSLAALALVVSGCASVEEWAHNGFKVGPNFHEPPVQVAAEWLDADDERIASNSADDGKWWDVFHDPDLQFLIDTAHRQNLDLKTAATRVLQTQGQRNIAAGNLFPQSHTAVGDYAHVQLGHSSLGGPLGGALPNTLNVWATGFNASWEIDFWGRMRRAIESSDAELKASVEGYRAALVTLTADVATNYVQIRTTQQRIAYARRNVEIQQGSLRLAEARLKEGKATSLDVEQARSSLAQTESSIPALVLGLRQANDRLCVLLGKAPTNLIDSLRDAPIPTAPPALAVGIPADLLQRRPDVRQALHDAHAQSAQIGVAKADFYPSIGVTGFIGYASDDIRRLFEQSSFTGLILPNFQWKILNYGRILNNVRIQNARYEEKVLGYQQTVLKAGSEVEDGLAGFLQYQLQARSLEKSVLAGERSVELVLIQYKEGRVDFNRVFTAQTQLVTQHDQLASAQGNIALSLIAAYRALGGGWQSFEKTPTPRSDSVSSEPARRGGNWQVFEPIPAPARFTSISLENTRPIFLMPDDAEHRASVSGDR
jgi:NodT family efflux transporter outer membrane factor (OMF) lipoprotein